jgi:hypothetical protein
VRLVVAVPAAQGVVAGVGEKKWQRRRFNVAVAKDHVGFALMAGIIDGFFVRTPKRIMPPKKALSLKKL